MASNDKEKSVAAELTAGSDSAATERTEEPQLAELVNQEAGLATEIELKVLRNDLVVPTQWTTSAYAESTNRSAIESRRSVLLGSCQTPEEKQNRAPASARSLEDWHHMEVQSLDAPQRQAGLYSHFMPHRNRSAQVAGAVAATEHVFPTSASANSYNRRRIAIDADAAIRSHGHCSQNP